MRKNTEEICCMQQKINVIVRLRNEENRCMYLDNRIEKSVY